MTEQSIDEQLVNRINDIMENPHKHVHDYDGMFKCCLHDGQLSSELLDAHLQEG